MKKPKSDHFSAQYDRIVAYGFPKVAPVVSKIPPAPVKIEKPMNWTKISLMILAVMMVLLGSIWGYCQLSQNTTATAADSIKVENVANGQIMGRP